MPVLLLAGFVFIVVWALYTFRKYRQKVEERQADLDTLYGRDSRKLDEDE
ncbi:MAG: hypothetical protein ACLPX1_14650 [Steroidobacteraceae bacterium]